MTRPFLLGTKLPKAKSLQIGLEPHYVLFRHSRDKEDFARVLRQHSQCARGCRSVSAINVPAGNPAQESLTNDQIARLNCRMLGSPEPDRVSNLTCIQRANQTQGPLIERIAVPMQLVTACRDVHKTSNDAPTSRVFRCTGPMGACWHSAFPVRSASRARVQAGAKLGPSGSETARAHPSAV